MRSRSVSLTGATGFVGWHLSEAFRDAGWRVRAVTRPDGSRLLPAGVDRTDASLTDPGALARAFEDSELVVHCAGVIRAKNEAAFAAVNVEGTRALVEAANMAGCRVLLISSLAAGGPGTPEKPRREQQTDAPVNAYGRSKRAGEEVLRRIAQSPWTIIRPCAVYGPRDRGFLPLFRMAQRGVFVLPTRSTMSFSLISVADLSSAVVDAASSPRAAGEVLFVGHGDPQSTDSILRTLAGVYGKPYTPVGLPRPVVRAAASIGDLAWMCGTRFVFDSGRLAEFDAEGFVCSVERARDVLGFTAGTSLCDGFARTAQWYRDAGWT